MTPSINVSGERGSAIFWDSGLLWDTSGLFWDEASGTTLVVSRVTPPRQVIEVNKSKIIIEETKVSVVINTENTKISINTI